MGLAQVDRITLDYQDAATRDERLLISLSAVAVAGRYLWTASDEGRTIECLEPDGDGYRLRGQYKIDRLFRKLPDADDGGGGRPDEADIESLAVCDGALWICASHCKVRKETEEARQEKQKVGGRFWLEPKFKPRPSRRLLGRVPLKDDGGGLDDHGEPSCWWKWKLAQPPAQTSLPAPLCRIEAKLDKRFRLKDGMVTHFLKLDGLGVRDLAAFGDEILILAGPVAEACAPFRLYRWRPANPKAAEYIQSPDEHPNWPVSVADTTTRGGNPEGICRLDRDRSGLIVLYDSPDRTLRIEGTRYRADWIAFA